MWAILGLSSALFLGIYDVFKKLSLNGNAVVPVLFFSTVTSSVIFLPIVICSRIYPELLQSIGLFVPPLNYIEHLQVLVKSIIVVSSWRDHFIIWVVFNIYA